MNHRPESLEYFLADPDWSAVRSIYKKLSDEFHVLTGSFGLQLDPKTKLMLDHVILGIDRVDQTIDQLPSKDKRDQITNSILIFLKDDKPNWNHNLAEQGLESSIKTIKQVISELKVTNRFLTAAEAIFDFTEQKRHTLNMQELIDFVQKEGRATAELPLSIMKVNSSHPFALFFTNLCMLMGIADLIVDAKSDYRLKYLALKPSLHLYLKLNLILVKEGFLILWNFPKKVKFLFYTIRLSWALITAKD